MLCDCDESGPLESIEDGVVVGDDLAVVEHEAVVVGVVVGDVDDLGPAQLVLQLGHELDLRERGVLACCGCGTRGSPAGRAGSARLSRAGCGSSSPAPA